MGFELVSPNGDGRTSAYARDFKKPTSDLLSVGRKGRAANYWSGPPSLSSNGRFAAFASRASNLVRNDRNKHEDVFVRDRARKSTWLVSRARQAANGGSGNPSISGSGRYVAFDSLASNLVPNDTNERQDVFVADRLKGTVERVSVDSLGQQGNAGSVVGKISADGRYIAFMSLADNLVLVDLNARQDVFLHDRVRRETTRVSTGVLGIEANHEAGQVAISADGNAVAFASQATNLVIGSPTDIVADPSVSPEQIYVHFVSERLTVRASETQEGLRGNGHSFDAALSGDGSLVAFSSSASNFGVGDGRRVYVKDLNSGRLSLVSKALHGQPNGDVYYAAISKAGDRIAFESTASNLVRGDTNSASDVFVTTPC